MVFTTSAIPYSTIHAIANAVCIFKGEMSGQAAEVGDISWVRTLFRDDARALHRCSLFLYLGVACGSLRVNVSHGWCAGVTYVTKCDIVGFW